ncbi:hypothetical protein [Acinetobacter lwoffii]|uniref:hypothetical protein n=1 Tax=Acinetobacter lwoffii TaxID=28090 RepID=UPI0021CDCE08|nr:hypothetical protein [Acinetobacter lwoffii]
MSDFEKWFEDQDFYTNMRFIHGDKLFDKDGDVYRVLPVQMTYQGWNTQRQRSKDEFVELTQEWHTKGWNARQGEIDSLKAQLNNMEACYIEKKKQVEACADLAAGWNAITWDKTTHWTEGYEEGCYHCSAQIEKALRGES